MSEVSIRAVLRPCPMCKVTLQIRNGVIDQPVTFWMDGQQSCLTAHTKTCPMRGQDLPPDDWGAGSYGGEDLLS